MTIKEVIDYMSEMKGVVSSRTMAKVKEILALATEYSYLGAKFSFNASKDLDTEATRLLLELSDEIILESNQRAKETIEDKTDEEAVMAYIHRDINGASATVRVDSHSSHLKVLLEGYFAVCFAKGLSSGDILGGTLRYLANPYTYTLVRESFKDADEYNAEFVRTHGLHFGRGIQSNPIDGMALIAGTLINEAFQYSTVLEYRKNSKIIGYRVYRGSGYDCGSCDELCNRVWPLDVMVLPNHPRCCCYTSPVYAE